MSRKPTIVHLTRGWENRVRGPGPFRIAQPVETPFRDDQYYSPAQVALTLGISRWTVYDWNYSGRLIAQKLPRRVRFLGKHINEFLARNQVA